MKVAAGIGGGLLSALGLLGSNVEAGLFLGAFFASGFFLASHILGVHEFILNKYPKLKIFVSKHLSDKVVFKTLFSTLSTLQSGPYSRLRWWYTDSFLGA